MQKQFGILSGRLGCATVAAHFYIAGLLFALPVERPAEMCLADVCSAVFMGCALKCCESARSALKCRARG